MKTTPPESLPARQTTTGPAVNRFVALCHELKSGRDPIEAILTGFDISLLGAAGDFFGVPAARIRAIAGVSEATADHLPKRPTRLDADASKRLWRLADVATMADDVFEDEAAAKHWLCSPNLTFLGAAPIDLLVTEPGARAVRQVLNAIATGGVA